VRKITVKKSILILAISIVLLNVPSQAEEFWRTGTIKRTLSDKKFGGCMVQLSTGISNGCPANGWVSLDCDATYLQYRAGERHYASALIAASIGKQVSILIDNAQKHDGYCVARRVDVIFP